MMNIARKFTEFKKEKHGDDVVLLFADNLDAHCHKPVLDFLHRQISFYGLLFLVAHILFSQ